MKPEVGLSDPCEFIHIFLADFMSCLSSWWQHWWCSVGCSVLDTLTGGKGQEGMSLLHTLTAPIVHILLLPSIQLQLSKEGLLAGFNGVPGFEVAKTPNISCAISLHKASHLCLANFPVSPHLQYALFLRAIFSWKTACEHQQPACEHQQRLHWFIRCAGELGSPLNFLISINLNLERAVSSSVSFASFHMRTQYPISSFLTNTGRGKQCPALQRFAHSYSIAQWEEASQIKITALARCFFPADWAIYYIYIEFQFWHTLWSCEICKSFCTHSLLQIRVMWAPCSPGLILTFVD